MNGKAKLEITTPTEREIVMTRAFDAPRHLVFDAWTQPELVRQWMLGPDGWTMPVCEIDLRVGGKYRYVWRRESTASEMGLSGTFREVQAPERLVSTEIFDEDWTGGEALSTLVLTERDGKTTATNTVLYASGEARDGALKSGMADGVSVGYDRLDEVLAEMAA